MPTGRNSLATRGPVKCFVLARLDWWTGRWQPQVDASGKARLPPHPTATTYRVARQIRSPVFSSRQFLLSRSSSFSIVIERESFPLAHTRTHPSPSQHARSDLSIRSCCQIYQHKPCSSTLDFFWGGRKPYHSYLLDGVSPQSHIWVCDIADFLSYFIILIANYSTAILKLP